MKAEAICTNDTCPTVDNISGRKQVQLLDHVSFRILDDSRRGGTITAYTDEEGNPLYCEWCNSPLRVERIARDEALFAIGEIEATEGAKRTLSFDTPDDPLAWMLAGRQYIAQHGAGLHGRVEDPDVSLNKEALELVQGQSLGRIVSAYDHKGVVLWIITERDRHKTTIMLPEEYE